MKARCVACRLFCILCAILLCCAPLLSCKKNTARYAPIASSKTDATVLLRADGDEMRYELFRYLFLSRHTDYDGGDPARWDAEDGAALWETARAATVRQMCDIYATFRIASRYGIDPWGDDMDNRIGEYVTADIDGGWINGVSVTGCGSVDAYVARLAENYLTDAVNRLLYRQVLTLGDLYDQIVNRYAEGTVPVTDAMLTMFLAGDTCIHYNQVYLPDSAFGGDRSATRSRAKEIRRDMAAATDYDGLIRAGFRYSYADDNSLAPVSVLEGGLWIGKYSFDSTYSAALTSALFTLRPGEISEIVETSDGCYILYGMEKTGDLPQDRDGYETIRALYLKEIYCREIAEMTDAMVSGLTVTDAFKRLTPQGLLTKTE